MHWPTRDLTFEVCTSRMRRGARVRLLTLRFNSNDRN